jgi:hypothetical protein
MTCDDTVIVLSSRFPLIVIGLLMVPCLTMILLFVMVVSCAFSLPCKSLSLLSLSPKTNPTSNPHHNTPTPDPYPYPNPELSGALAAKITVVWEAGTG